MVSPLRPRFFRPPLAYPSVPYDFFLREHARRNPERTAILFHSERITYRELDALTNSLANALLGLGVEKGMRVALYMSNRPEYEIAWFALSRIGAVATPLNPAYKAREVLSQLRDAEAAFAIVHEPLLPVIDEVRPQLPGLRGVIALGRPSAPGDHDFYELLAKGSPYPPPCVPLDPLEDLMALPYSSGTTGLPKGVMLTHQVLVTNHIQFASAASITERDVFLIFLPFYHIYGTLLLGTAISAGATQIIMEGFDLERSLDLVEAHRATLYFAVPPVLLAMARYPRLKERDLSSIRFIMVGAAPVVPEVSQEIRNATGVLILQGYGLTEGGPLTHLNPLIPELARIDSAGFPLSDVEVKIVDVEMGLRELPRDQVGEIAIRGPLLMKAYWKSPEATAAALRDGWLYTGDLGRVDEEGYLYVVDRKKEMIKYKAFSVAPAELEALLHEHAAVQDCAVIGKPDPEAGEIPKAFVQVADGTSVSQEELIQYVADRVAGYKKIREVEFVDTIPRNPSGKILRRVLRERERDRAIRGKEQAPGG